MPPRQHKQVSERPLGISLDRAERIDDEYALLAELDRPTYGDPITVASGEASVFWAYGVTAQAAVLNGRPDLVISHTPATISSPTSRAKRCSTDGYRVVGARSVGKTLRASICSHFSRT